MWGYAIRVTLRVISRSHNVARLAMRGCGSGRERGRGQERGRGRGYGQEGGVGVVVSEWQGHVQASIQAVVFVS